MDEQLIVEGCLWEDVEAAPVTSRLTRTHRAKRKIDKEQYLQDIEGAYHAIGGFARLAHLANEDPRWFFNRFGDRLLPNVKEELDVNITIVPPLPPSALDVEVVDVIEKPKDAPQLSAPEENYD